MIDNDIVITGAAGFIGQNLTKFLKKKKIKFRAYSRKKNNLSKLIKKYTSIKPIGKSTLIYLSQSNGARSKINDELNILKKIIKYEWNYIIFLSSAKVYKKDKHKLNELSKIDLGNNYSKLKINSEKIIETSKKGISLRISNIYGPFYNKKTLIDDILKNIFNKKIISIKNKNEYVDLLNIEDLNDLILSLLKNKKYGIFNVASGSIVKIETLINQILNLLNLKIKINSSSSIKNKMKNKIDISLIKKITGWKPKITIRKGINEIYKKNLYLHRKQG